MDEAQEQVYTGCTKERGMEKVETIELYFHVFDSETWKERFDTETVSLVVN